MQRYRIEVGRNHDARPGDIVGAIANEAGISSANIGHIKLHDEFSTVDLPKGLSADVLNKLKKVRVRNRPLEITPDQGGFGGNRDGGDRATRSFDKPRSFGDKPRSNSDKPRSKPHFGDKPRAGAGDAKKSFRPKKFD